MRLFAPLLVVITLLTLSTVTAIVEITYDVDVLRITAPPSDIFSGGAEDSQEGEFVWQITGLHGNVFFPPSWGACGTDAIAAVPCFRGSTLIVPVLAAKLAAGAPLTLPLPSIVTTPGTVLITASLRRPPVILPIVVARSHVQFAGERLSPPSDAGVLVKSSFVPTTVIDDDTSVGELFVFLTPNLPVDFTLLSHVTVVLPSGLSVTADPPARVGFNSLEPEAYSNNRLRTRRSEHAISIPITYSSRREMWLKSFVLTLSDVRFSRVDQHPPIIRVFMSAQGRTFALPLTHMQYLPIPDDIAKGYSVAIFTIHTDETYASAFNGMADFIRAGQVRVHVGGRFPGETSAAFVMEVYHHDYLTRALLHSEWAETVTKQIARNILEDGRARAGPGPTVPWAVAGAWMCPAAESTAPSFVKCPEDACGKEVCVFNDSSIADLYCSFEQRPRKPAGCRSSVAPVPPVLET